jgi:hypothetical protein
VQTLTLPKRALGEGVDFAENDSSDRGTAADGSLSFLRWTLHRYQGHDGLWGRRWCRWDTMVPRSHFGRSGTNHCVVHAAVNNYYEVNGRSDV